MCSSDLYRIDVRREHRAGQNPLLFSEIGDRISALNEGNKLANRGHALHLPNWKPRAELFFLVACGLAQNPTCTLGFDLCVRELARESFPVEPYGAGAWNNFDVFELQRLTAR